MRRKPAKYWPSSAPSSSTTATASPCAPRQPRGSSPTVKEGASDRGSSPTVREGLATQDKNTRKLTRAGGCLSLQSELLVSGLLRRHPMPIVPRVSAGRHPPSRDSETDCRTGRFVSTLCNRVKSNQRLAKARCATRSIQKCRCDSCPATDP